ncbi:MAG: hypothetical protein V1735_01145, partial [Nanoarchaeota archaeon]
QHIIDQKGRNTRKRTHIKNYYLQPRKENQDDTLYSHFSTKHFSTRPNPAYNVMLSIELRYSHLKIFPAAYANSNNPELKVMESIIDSQTNFKVVSYLFCLE